MTSAKHAPGSVSSIFVDTSRAQAAFARLDDLMEEGWEQTFCRALLLLGPARCVSAWKRDPVSGVIGVQLGPP